MIVSDDSTDLVPGKFILSFSPLWNFASYGAPFKPKQRPQPRSSKSQITISLSASPLAVPSFHSLNSIHFYGMDVSLDQKPKSKLIQKNIYPDSLHEIFQEMCANLSLSLSNKMFLKFLFHFSCSLFVSIMTVCVDWNVRRHASTIFIFSKPGGEWCSAFQVSKFNANKHSDERSCYFDKFRICHLK